MGKVRGEKALLPYFSLAVFWAIPQLSCHVRLEEANLFLVMFQLISDPSHFQVVDIHLLGYFYFVLS